MAPATLNKLRQKAKKLGVSAKEIRGADREELQTLIEQQSNGNSKPAKKSAVKKASKAVAKKSAKKSAPAKSSNAKGTAKRQTTRKATTEPKGGRNTLDGVNFSEDDGWNPRPGSAPDRIIKALRKFKGNRQKTYEFLLPEIGDFVKSKKSDGTAWDKGEGPGTRKGMLKYRIARTAWQFALQTGQHEASDNRVEYGTGGTGSGIFKPASKRNKTKAAPAKATKARSKGRKSGARKGRKATAKR